VHSRQHTPSVTLSLKVTSPARYSSRVDRITKRSSVRISRRQDRQISGNCLTPRILLLTSGAVLTTSRPGSARRTILSGRIRSPRSASAILRKRSYPRGGSKPTTPGPRGSATFTSPWACQSWFTATVLWSSRHRSERPSMFCRVSPPPRWG
jgi:hypothetical protein